MLHTDTIEDRSTKSGPILSYWFADLDNASPLDRSAEPFRSCFARWYGKDDAIDREIRARFEPTLREVVTQAPWDRELEGWERAPRGLLALVVLLDQLPRNMYRGTAQMYAHDERALATARYTIGRYEREPLPLVHRMFLYVPLMHAEDMATQREMVGLFESLVDRAAIEAPHHRGFFEHALGYARKHAEVIERFGRFPHRNVILDRRSSPEEEEYLRGPDAGF
jgi:uncharacterized protein (DUF924 family)